MRSRKLPLESSEQNRKGIWMSHRLTYEELDEKFEFHVPNYSEAMEIIAGKKPVEIY